MLHRRFRLFFVSLWRHRLLLSALTVSSQPSSEMSDVLMDVYCKCGLEPVSGSKVAWRVIIAVAAAETTAVGVEAFEVIYRKCGLEPVSGSKVAWRTPGRICGSPTTPPAVGAEAFEGIYRKCGLAPVSGSKVAWRTSDSIPAAPTAPPAVGAEAFEGIYRKCGLAPVSGSKVAWRTIVAGEPPSSPAGSGLAAVRASRPASATKGS